MANRIQIKRTLTFGNTAPLESGELAIDLGANPPKLMVGTDGTAQGVKDVGPVVAAPVAPSTATAHEGSIWVDTTNDVIYFLSNGEWQTTDVYETFAELLDTPEGYTGSGGAVLRVNAGETGVEFGDLSLDELSDVEYPAEPTENQILKFVGGSWKPTDEPAPVVMGEFLGTVDATQPVPAGRPEAMGGGEYQNGDFYVNNTDGAIDGSWAAIGAPTNVDLNDVLLTDGEGTWYFLSSTIDPTLFIRNDGAASVTADIPWGGNKITGLGDPEGAGDATNKAYVDGRQFIQMPDTPGAAAGDWATQGVGEGAKFVRLNGTEGGDATGVVFDEVSTADLADVDLTTPPAAGEALVWDTSVSPARWVPQIVDVPADTFATQEEVIKGTGADKVVSPVTGTGAYLVKARGADMADIPQTVANTTTFKENVTVEDNKTLQIGGTAGTGGIVSFPEGGVLTGAAGATQKITIQESIIDGGTF